MKAIQGGPTRPLFDILPQPDDVTCGPTCLHAVYAFYGDDVPLDALIREISPSGTGGTLAVILGRHALRRGYGATIYTYNLALFDPSWFDGDVDIAERLRAQAEAKADARLRFATESYLDFLALGGELRFRELTPELIAGPIRNGTPILTGLSATYLYGCPREVDDDGRLRYDDVRGAPTGHFVVLCGYDPTTHEVTVADPLHENPRFGAHSYAVGVHRLVGALLLGVLTYDANFLIIQPADGTRTA